MRAVPACATQLVVEGALAGREGLCARESFYVRHPLWSRDLQFIDDLVFDPIILTGTMKEVDHWAASAAMTSCSRGEKQAFTRAPGSNNVQTVYPPLWCVDSGRALAGRALAV